MRWAQPISHDPAPHRPVGCPASVRLSVCMQVFGAFLASDLAQRHKSKGQFFGTGESFLFTLQPTAACHRWTGESSFFLLAQEGELVVGGGGG